MELDIEVLWNTDQTTLAEKTGIKIDTMGYTTKICTIYTVDCLIPYDHFEDKSYKYTKLLSGTEEFIIPHSRDKVKLMIRAAKMQDFMN